MLATIILLALRLKKSIKTKIHKNINIHIFSKRERAIAVSPTCISIVSNIDIRPLFIYFAWCQKEVKESDNNKINQLTLNYSKTKFNSKLWASGAISKELRKQFLGIGNSKQTS